MDFTLPGNKKFQKKFLFQNALTMFFQKLVPGRDLLRNSDRLFADSIGLRRSRDQALFSRRDWLFAAK